MRGLFTSLTLLPFALGAWQEARAEWIAVTTSHDGSVFSIDPDRMRTVAGKRQVWMKGDHSRNRGERARSSMTLLSFDCGASTVRTLSETNYDSYGKTISSRSNPDYSFGYNPITPETITDNIAKLACEGRESS